MVGIRAWRIRRVVKRLLSLIPAFLDGTPSHIIQLFKGHSMREQKQSNSPHVTPSENDLVWAASEMRCLVRQPVLDIHSRIHSYELLFQLQSDHPLGGRGSHAMRAILDNILLYGLDKLTKGVPVFITCSGEALTTPYVTMLPSQQTILGIPEQLQFYPNMVPACNRLKGMGYRLALQNFNWGPFPHVLLPMVDYVKLSLEDFDSSGLKQLRRATEGTSAVLLAEKIDTQEAYGRACREGFSYFQGYYFCHPQYIERAKVPVDKLFHIELLQQLQRDPLDLKKIEPLVKRNAALVYRLLKLVNSPLCAIRQEIHSIESAILMLGETTFRRVATVAILSELNAGQATEILHVALVRARFCELAADGSDMDSEEQYLLGLLSLLPAMLCRPMEELASELPLRAELRQALIGESLRERCLLAWIETHERNEALKAHAIANAYGLDVEKLERVYVDAVMWESLSVGAFK